MTFCFLLASVLSLWVQKTTLLSIKASQGQVFLHFFLGCPQWGASNLPKDAIQRLHLCLSSKREERNWHQQELHAQTACCIYHWAKYLYMLKTAQVEQTIFFLNGWNNLSLGYFQPLASQQMLLWADCFKVLGRTWPEDWMLSESYTGEQKFYTAQWGKTLGNTRNLYGLMLLSTFSAS